ncbi:MAG: peptidase dimerization domain-containing protein [Pseudomonadota bacterium]
MLATVSSIDTLISDEHLTETLCELVNTRSPTGEEASLAGQISARLRRYGVNADTQSFNKSQANAIGRIDGEGDKSLLLYAPLDTVTSDHAEEDLPWAGPELRDDMRACAFVEDGHVFGLGAHNPKGHAACILETARVLAVMDTKLAGNLFFGFGAGGMPTHSRPGLPEDTGHGVGCRHLVESLPPMDGAIIAKSGTSVTWEEVGFVWLEVTVAGKHNYVGARHLMPYDNAIANAAQLILQLEEWFDTYAARNASENCRPQGTVAHMSSGWERMPAFTPECAKFLIDLRFTPEQTAEGVEKEFAEALKTFSAALNLQTSYRVTQTINASRTPPTSPVIKTAIRVWESIHGQPHIPFTVMSGATDANILRGLGIPTARIGLAKAKLPNIDFALGMNCVALSELRQLTKFLTLSVLNFLGEKSDG